MTDFDNQQDDPIQKQIQELRKRLPTPEARKAELVALRAELREEIKMKKSRAEQIAAMAGPKLERLGKLPDKPEKLQSEKETPEQLAKRRELRAKLKSFAE